MDPPQCIQNAMMTKDKKPFTYTPGGIDLSQVRSPRMQRRIERNATLGGDNEVPRPAPPPPQNYGPLPPSALAAMRPQTQVQVFPGPPPPPMQKNIPPPPPPPCAPLPTQKVTTSENQVVERPDMTKIIPDNPMSLLRKTGGPAPKKSFVDQMYENQNSPPSPPQRTYEAQSPMYQPPVVEQSSPVSPIVQQRQPQQYQSTQQQGQPPHPQSQYQPSYQSNQQVQPTYQQQRTAEAPKSPIYSPVIERQPSTPPTQKNVGSNVGSLYIPPINQQQQKVASPPSPPERSQEQVHSPGTPTLKEAPRPWQQKNVQQELPPWFKKDDNEETPTQSPSNVGPNMQQRWQPQVAAPQQQPAKQQQQFTPRSPQSQPQTPPNQGYPTNSFPVHIEIRTSVPYQGDSEPAERKPNAVYVTKPVVLQHPGPGFEPVIKVQPKQQPIQAQQPANHYEQSPNQYQPPRQQVQQQVQSPKIDASGTRIIPIQIERTPPTTPSGDRNLNRQMSWGSQPTQSNSFKVIQKFTNTEDEEEDDTPVTHHSARFPQEMPEQVRRMKVNDNGQFRQVPQQNNAGRTIPIQSEGNGHPSQQQYVHPSEQVVPEPKKYMGSNIPGRSFKILQAMTAPSDNNNCANANNNDEPKFNPTYYPYAYPPYPPPYWPDYYTNFSPKEQSDPNEKSRSCRSPLNYHQSYWQDYYPGYPTELSESTSRMSDKSCKSGRSTPILPPMPYWMPPPPYVRSRSTTPKPENTLRPQTPQKFDNEEQYHYPRFPPYFDPYYFSYYFGYPPMMMHPHSHYASSAENDEQSGYSSMDEMSDYNQRKRRNSLENDSNSVQFLRQQFEVRSKSAAPRITVTPTHSKEDIPFNVPPDKEKSFNNTENFGGLRSIKSVQNINVYDDIKDNSSSESEYETSDEETPEEDQTQDDTIPHQLSVIYEESESRRCNSACSESTTIAEHQSEEEDEDFLASQNVKFKICMFQETSEMLSVRTDVGRNIRSFKEETETFSSFSLNKDFVKKGDVEDYYKVEEVESDVDEVVMRMRPGTVAEVDASIADVKKAKGPEENVDSDRINEKAETVMVKDEEDEVVCVKLRNKKGKVKGVSEKNTFGSSSKRSNLCDESIVPEETPMGFGGMLMKIDSFVSQFEAIKRNSGLWNYDEEVISKPEDLSSEANVLECKAVEEKVLEPLTNIVKENNLECIVEKKLLVPSTNIADDNSLELVVEEKLLEPLEDIVNENNLECDTEEIVEEKTLEPVEDESSAESEVDFWSQIKTDDDDLAPRRRSYYRREEDDNCPESVVDTVDSSSSCDRAIDLSQQCNTYTYESHSLNKSDDESEEETPMKRCGENKCSPITIQIKSDIESELNFSESEEENTLRNCDPIVIQNKPNYDCDLKETKSDDESESSSSESEEAPVKNCGPIIIDNKFNYNCDLSKIKSNESESNSSESDQEAPVENCDTIISENKPNFNSCLNDIKSDDDSESNSSETEEQAPVENCNSITIKNKIGLNEIKSDDESESNSSESEEETPFENGVKNKSDVCINYQSISDSSGSDVSDSSESEPEEEEKEQKSEGTHTHQTQNSDRTSRSRSLEPQTIKERIEALKNCVARKQSKESEIISVSVKTKVSAFEAPTSESLSKTTSTKSSIKSFEEYSEEEELDSGVNSDISRHISDTEEFPELRKMTRYERAATHSRLFKLLQEECDVEEKKELEESYKVSKEDKFSKLSVRRNRETNLLSPSRSKLSLPLVTKCSEPDVIATNLTVNEKLVEELVQSLLRSRKAQVFRNMPKEKLYSAAVRILQEGNSNAETPSEEFSSLLSPLRGDTENSTPAQTPQEFYADSDYRQYYDSWSDAALEIMPSKAFKLLQDHLGANKVGTIEGIFAKCPRILSSKNILKTLEENGGSDCSSPLSYPLPEANEVTNT